MSVFLPAHHLDKDPAEENFNAAAIILPDSLTTTRTASETAASTKFLTLPRRPAATMALSSSLAIAARELKNLRFGKIHVLIYTNFLLYNKLFLT